MKELTKEDIMNIVREANKETLEEYFPGEAGNNTKARKENLWRYNGLIQGAKNFFDQIIKKAKSDYENDIIGDSDIDYLINDQMERAIQAVEYVKSSLVALKTQGIKPSETGPVYPASKYEQ